MAKDLPHDSSSLTPVKIRHIPLWEWMFAAFFLLSFVQSVNTTISGVINDYAAVTGIQSQSVEVTDVSDFSVGDKVLLIQMKGAYISETDDATYGDIQSYGNAGNYEFHIVSSISNDTLFFDEPVCGDFTVVDLVQIVRVPVYENVTVSGTLTATQWNGSIGGILALEATGTLTLNADMDVRESGFNGGDRNGSASPGGLTYICAFNSGQGGIKGEGITEVSQDACRGKLANGGGGGNDHNGGGGGGGNYGSGGVGGHGWKSNTPGNLSDLNKGGRGGAALSELYELGIPKLFLGGGGGGGHQNNGAALAASNGAGIVIVIAHTLNASSAVTIRANALDATDVNVHDGAGGGGAGGSVLLDVETFTNPGNLTIDVSGGDGASISTRDQHGPGGGGAGGYVNSTSTLPGTITIHREGGDPGLFVSTTNPSNPYTNTSHGAAEGDSGSVIENLVLQNCSEPPFLDLDSGEEGYDYTVTMVIHDSTVALADSLLDEILDDDNVNMYFAIITLENPLYGDQEGLILPLSLPAGLKAQISSDNYTITLSGEATIREYEKAISLIQYFNYSGNVDLTTREISVQVNDGGAESNVAYTYIIITDATLTPQWTFFIVSQETQESILEWQISQRITDPCFEVFRSYDGKNFEKIVSINSSEFVAEANSWSFRDKYNLETEYPVIYYQIVYLPEKGSTLYSPVVRVSRPVNKDIRIEVYHERESNEVFLYYSAGKSRVYNLSVTDLRGNTMWTKPYSGITSTGKIILNVADWASGVYFVSLQSEVGRKTQKIILR
ncbi:MAG: T9SS type A sorting domain-containing protein [Bacteroidia bacterium]|nr:T9SS type A sorting domain-containing protein [Bacteroidia bacterium]